MKVVIYENGNKKMKEIEQYLNERKKKKIEQYLNGHEKKKEFHALKEELYDNLSKQYKITSNKPKNAGFTENELKLLMKWVKNTDCIDNLKILEHIVAPVANNSTDIHIFDNLTAKKYFMITASTILLTTAIVSGLVTGGIAVPVIAALTAKLSSLLGGLTIFHGLAAATMSLTVNGFISASAVIGALFAYKKYKDYDTLSSIETKYSEKHAKSYYHLDILDDESHNEALSLSEKHCRKAITHQEKSYLLKKILEISKDDNNSKYSIVELSVLAELVHHTDCQNTLNNLEKIINIINDDIDPFTLSDPDDAAQSDLFKHAKPKETLMKIASVTLLTTAIVFGLVSGGIAVPVIAALVVKLTSLLSGLTIFHGVAAATISLGVTIACGVIAAGALYLSGAAYNESKVYKMLSSIQKKISSITKQPEISFPESEPESDSEENTEVFNVDLGHYSDLIGQNSVGQSDDNINTFDFQIP